MKGIDTNSNTTKYVESIKKCGYEFVGRYYNVNDKSKNLTKDETVALSNAGLYIVSIWENGYPTAVSYFEQPDRGALDGMHAIIYAHRTIGQPGGTPIYFAVDYDAYRPDIIGPIKSYFESVRHAFFEYEKANQLEKPYLIGSYGSGEVNTYLRSAGLVHYIWLSQSTGWTDTEKLLKSRHQPNLVQGRSFGSNIDPLPDIGINYDEDESYGDGGGWLLSN